MSWPLVLGFWIAFYVMMHLLIFVHEVCHLLAARSVGAPIQELSSGVGPILFSIKRKYYSINFRLWPVAGYVIAIGGHFLPHYSRDERTALMAIDRTHPGLRKRNWLRRKNGMQRIFIVLAGPVGSVALGLCIIFGTVSFLDPIIAFNEIPRDARCASAALVDLELDERGMVEGEITFCLGEKSHTFQGEKLDRWVDNGQYGEAVTLIRHYWEKDPNATLTVEHGNSPPLTFSMTQVIDAHAERMKKFSRAESETAPDATFFQATIFQAEQYGKVAHAYPPRDAITRAWQKTLLGRVIDEGMKCWRNSFAAFCWYTAILSIGTGIFNLMPLYPLDGGRITQDLGIMLGIRGKKVVPFIRVIGKLSIFFVVVVLTLLPLLADFVLLIWHSV